jgi:mono/diheme cytochrome c family protein
MKTRILSVAGGILAILLGGCYGAPKSGAGLHLPEGSIERGQAAFLALKCNQCHRVEGLELPAPTSTVATNIVLGGKVSRIQTHGELVTCVVNPSHELAPGFNKKLAKDGKTSPMPNLNDQMTVSQLIDVVTFLQSRYEMIEPGDTRYIP